MKKKTVNGQFDQQKLIRFVFNSYERFWCNADVSSVSLSICL